MEVDGRKFFFDCTALTHKKANEKRELVFALDKVEGEGTIRLVVSYSERGKITKTDDILKALKKAGHSVKEATFDKATRVFARQSEVDFFINKDARGFLSEQLDLWMFQYLFKDETQWNEKRIQQLQTIKSIAQKVIAFIAQFEDERVRVWNKPKFVRGTHYIITLDRIAAREGGTALIADFLKHEGMKVQITEWQELGIVAEGFDARSILNDESKKAGKGVAKEKTSPGASLPAFLPSSLNPAWRSLPFDTLHFKSLELRLLALFDDLDNQLDGRLIKSENYQALNTLKDKFKGRVKCCYIDPPYNTGSDGFVYNDTFRHSSWISMMQDRISAAVPLLANKGVMYASIDDKERRHLEFALDQAFGRDNRVEEIIWVQNTTKNQSPTYSTNHEYVEVYARDLKAVSADARIFREPKPGYAEVMELIEKLNPQYPAIADVEAAIAELFETHKMEFKDELEEMGVEYDKNLDLWKGLYNYGNAEYRDADGKLIAEKDAAKKAAALWI